MPKSTGIVVNLDKNSGIIWYDSLFRQIYERLLRVYSHVRTIKAERALNNQRLFDMLTSVVIWSVISGMMVVSLGIRIADDHRGRHLGVRHSVKSKEKIHQ